MKGIKKFFLLLTLVAMVTMQPFTVMADSNNAIDVTREYLDDGSYFEIVITSNSNARSTIKNASKTATYKNASGQSLWYAKVTANFYFDGSTSSCTSSSASAGSYVNVWKILSKSASRTGNVGSATVVAGAYLNGAFVDSHTEIVTLACDKNGNLS